MTEYQLYNHQGVVNSITMNTVILNHYIFVLEIHEYLNYYGK